MNWWIVTSIAYTVGWAVSLRAALDIVLEQEPYCHYHPKSHRMLNEKSCKNNHDKDCWRSDGVKKRTPGLLWAAAFLTSMWPCYAGLRIGQGVYDGGAWLLDKAIPLTKGEKKVAAQQAKLELEKQEEETKKLAKEFDLPSTDLVVVEPTELITKSVAEGLDVWPTIINSYYLRVNGEFVIVEEWSDGRIEKRRTSNHPWVES